MDIEGKEARLRELFAQKDAVTGAIHALLGDGIVNVEAPKAKRKYARRAQAPSPKPAKKGGKPCCGTLGRRHKNGCAKARVLGGEGKLPPDEKTWRCVNCDHKRKAEEQPEECAECPGTVFVEVEDWK